MGKNDVSINNWMVRNGWAVASLEHSYEYAAAEDEAKEAKRGMWASQFVLPYIWRKMSKRKPQPECVRNACTACEGVAQ